MFGLRNAKKKKGKQVKELVLILSKVVQLSLVHPHEFTPC